MSHEGIHPTLHHRDPRIPDWALSIAPGIEKSRFWAFPPGRSFLQTKGQSNGSVLQLSGLCPSIEQSVNEIVVASLMHRTFNVSTN